MILIYNRCQLLPFHCGDTLHRLTLNIALLVFVIPSFGMAGVIVDSHAISVEQSISASLGDQTPAPSHPEQLITERNMFGMTSSSVTTTSSSPNAISGWPVLFVKVNPPVESIYALSEWLFIPDSPVLKIPKVPIVLNVA